MPDAPVTLPEEMEKLITSCVCKCMKCRGRSEALRSAIAEISRERDEYRHARDTLALDYAADKALVRSAESRLREVGRERDEANRLNFQSSLRGSKTLVQELDSRIRELEEALRTYGRHKDGCWLLPDCVCGFEKFSPAPIFRAKRPTSTETDHER